MIKPKVVSLFTGCGGSDAGLIKAGFDVVMANDILPYAQEFYLANHPETDYVLKDIRQVTSFPSSDLLVGCYPCQGFSQGGAREADKKINYLYKEFARALQQISPKAFIVENVSGMMRSNFAHLLRDQLSIFEASGEQGYHVSYALLNAQDYGVAQNRKRILIVGIRKDVGEKFVFPLPTHDGTLAQPFVTIRDALAGLPDWPTNGEFCDQPFHWYYMSRDRRNDWGDTSRTIVSNMRHMPLHPISPKLIKVGVDEWQFSSDSPARRFSYREAARLQGFGDVMFPREQEVNIRHKYTVIGNAVPPPLFEAVVKAMPDIW